MLPVRIKSRDIKSHMQLEWLLAVYLIYLPLLYVVVQTQNHFSAPPQAAED